MNTFKRRAIAAGIIYGLVLAGTTGAVAASAHYNASVSNIKPSVGPISVRLDNGRSVAFSVGQRVYGDVSRILVHQGQCVSYWRPGVDLWWKSTCSVRGTVGVVVPPGHTTAKRTK